MTGASILPCGGKAREWSDGVTRPGDMNDSILSSANPQSSLHPNDAPRGLLQAVVRQHWNWNPMRPVVCVGGIVRFGAYYECWVDGKMTLQTPLQFEIKCSMGLVPPNDQSSATRLGEGQK